MLVAVYMMTGEAMRTWQFRSMVTVEHAAHVEKEDAWVDSFALLVEPSTLSHELAEYRREKLVR